ncbi:dCMP deaminase family protein [Candidatus Woesearchaeota archaeon]|nr:dCMP deaminase family protein [Candidatus Woesearchaeota archaeon]
MAKTNSENKRPTWDRYFLNITKDVSERSNCVCVKIGAIIVKDKRILSTGYVGAPRKTKDCLERGSCLRRELNIPSGHRYELCRSVHAEQNAIINAARAGVSIEEADMYIFGRKTLGGEDSLIDIVPCFICKKMIINAGINRVICNTKDDQIRIFEVEQWVSDWKERDMTDDMDIYSTKYNKTEDKRQ